MTAFTVHYMTPEFFREGTFGARPDPAKLSATHTELADIEVPEAPLENMLGLIFHHFQGEVWSPNGEARDLIRSKGLEHTSMSVGDVIVNKANGQVFVVAPRGFDLVSAPRKAVI
jgi:hypothetical protein